MRSLLGLLVISFPLLASGSEFMKVECFGENNQGLTRTFEGFVFGTVTKIEGRLEIQGQTVRSAYVSRDGTSSDCKSPRQYRGTSTNYVRVPNTLVMEYDYGSLDITCASGSVVLRYGDLKRFQKAMVSELKREQSDGGKPYCLDLSALE